MSINNTITSIVPAMSGTLVSMAVYGQQLLVQVVGAVLTLLVIMAIKKIFKIK